MCSYVNFFVDTFQFYRTLSLATLVMPIQYNRPYFGISIAPLGFLDLVLKFVLVQLPLDLVSRVFVHAYST